tara:strand:- start:239 stop:460 length:222 start_codon:yes stop_codon:yes gene_type:complete
VVVSSYGLVNGTCSDDVGGTVGSSSLSEFITSLTIQPKHIDLHLDLNTINNNDPNAPAITTTRLPISDNSYII